MNIKEKVEEGYLLGCIKYKQRFAVYLMPIAWWILNYTKYDPMYNSKDWNSIFRGNIYIVTDQLIDQYIQEVQVYKLNIEELKKINAKGLGVLFEILVDFDQHVFVNAFPEIELENYLPPEYWEGRYSSLNDYLPKELLAILN